MTGTIVPVVLKFDGGNRITLDIAGATQVLDIEADVQIGDIDEDLEAMPGLLAWYHRVLAAAHLHLDTVDAGYRRWQAESVQNMLADDPKVSEWKTKASLAASPQFDVWKSRQALASELVARLSGAVAALEVKASVLQTVSGRHSRVDVEERARQLADRSQRDED